LTNVIRHAEATRVEVRISAKEGILILEVEDNGKGISEAATADSRSFGLIGVKERAYSLGGEVTITGVRNEGTCLTVKMPISERKNCHD
jgi:signal transduction histidine kinase